MLNEINVKISLSFFFIACSVDHNAENEVDMVLKKQLKEDLKAITEYYGESNNGFIYTVFKNDTAQIQVVHSSYIQELNAPVSEFGLAIAISFDSSFPEEMENHRKFKESEYFSKFTAYQWDGIPCYGINLKSDYDKVAVMLSRILEDIYGWNHLTNYSTDLVNQGPLR